MPKSRKRHHSRSKSRSHSRERSRDRDDKHKKIDSHDKDGKRRKIDAEDSPLYKRSVSSEPECPESSVTETSTEDDAKMEMSLETNNDTKESKIDVNESVCEKTNNDTEESKIDVNESVCEKSDNLSVAEAEVEATNAENKDEAESIDVEKPSSSFSTDEKKKEKLGNIVENESQVKKFTVDILDDPEKKSESKLKDPITPAKQKPTPKQNLTPKQLQKKLELERKKQEKQKEKEEKERKRNEEKEEKERKRNEEKEKIVQEKLKKKEEKQKEIEMKQKEKELKEEQKRKEREEKEEQKKKEKEEKELKRKEKEEKEEQKKKEKEQEKIKKQQEIEEKNKEKQKEEEKKQKTVAAFASFFVPKKSDNAQEEKKIDDLNSSLFMAFEIKSDMKLPPIRRNPLTDEEKENIVKCLEKQSELNSYLQDLKSGKTVRHCAKTWPFEDFEASVDDDVVVIEENSTLGQSICEDKTKQQKFRAKFLQFHDNRRPAYYGTWRKKSKCIKARKPFAADNDTFNYEEDSDDDWEEEEQGESLKDSDEEADKENDDEKDDYDIDNDFFVPHGHLSDDEIDDEETAKLSPESLKQKLKLLKDEFDQDMQSKTHKLKPRFIGCVWYKKDGSNVEEAIDRYLQPLAIISNGQILIKKRSEINLLESSRKTKPVQELNSEYIPMLIKVVHGNQNKKRVIIEQYLTYMANNGIIIDIKKSVLLRNLKEVASWQKCNDKGPMKNKFCWYVSKDVAEKFNVNLQLPNILECENK